MKKKCLRHGDFRVILSHDPQFFSELMRAYYILMPKGLPVKILELAVTPYCSLNCPICSVMDSIGESVRPLNAEDAKKIIREHPDKEFLLWGLEPTDNLHLKNILQILKKNGKKANLFTNGIMLADFEYLAGLRDAGLSHVYLQFDGFDDETYKVLRGRRMLENKITVLENLKRLNIPTTLNITLAKGVNESQIKKIIDYALKNDFIKQLGFLPLMKIGKAESCKKDIIPQYYEFLEILEKETEGKINRDSLKIFQKLMYLVYRFSGFRRCFWFILFIIIRDKKKGEYITIADLIDLSKLEKTIDSYINKVEKYKKRRWFLGELVLCFKLAPFFLKFQIFNLVWNYFVFLLKGKKIESVRNQNKFIFITYTDFCDFYKMDLGMSDEYCEEMLAVKNKQDEIVYKPTYVMVIETAKQLRAVPK